MDSPSSIVKTPANTDGCDDCRDWLLNDRPGRIVLCLGGHREDGTRWLYVCRRCGTFWETTLREAHVISPGAARAAFPDVELDWKTVVAHIVERLLSTPVVQAIAERIGTTPAGARDACVETAEAVAQDQYRSSLLDQRIALVQRLRASYPALDAAGDPTLAEILLADTGIRGVGSPVALPDGTQATVVRRGITSRGGVLFTMRTSEGRLFEDEFFD